MYSVHLILPLQYCKYNYNPTCIIFYSQMCSCDLSTISDNQFPKTRIFSYISKYKWALSYTWYKYLWASAACISCWSMHRVNNTHLPQLYHSLVFVLGGRQVPPHRVQFQLQLLYLIHVPGFHLSLWMFQGILYQKVKREASNTAFEELIEIISILFKITHTAIWALKYCKCIIFSLYDIWRFIIKIFCI